MGVGRPEMLAPIVPAVGAGREAAAYIGVSRDRVVGIDPPGHAAADVVVEEVELVVPKIGERLQVVAEIDGGIAIGSVEAAKTCGRGEASVRDPLGPGGRTIENR